MRAFHSLSDSRTFRRGSAALGGLFVFDFRIHRGEAAGGFRFRRNFENAGSGECFRR